MSDHKTLETLSEKALWLEGRYDDMPSRLDAHISDVIKLAKQVINEINAIEEESVEWGRQVFGANRIGARVP